MSNLNFNGFAELTSEEMYGVNGGMVVSRIPTVSADHEKATRWYWNKAIPEREDLGDKIYTWVCK